MKIVIVRMKIQFKRRQLMIRFLIGGQSNVTGYNRTANLKLISQQERVAREMDENIYLVDISNLIMNKENGQRNEGVEVGWHFIFKDMTF